jgi:23S rRNA pseudouridine1911/1915/1917 synthase
MHEKNAVKFPDVLYEDNHTLIINKRASEIVQGDKTGDLPLSEIAKEYLKVKYNKPGEVFLGVVHRLDRPVSGALIFARTSKALARYNKLIKNREIRKIYWGIVRNKPTAEQDILVNYLLKDQVKNKSFTVKINTPGSMEAKLSYRLLTSSKTYHLLEIELHTGRHHQIRAQLAAIGCPIKGDLKSGFPRSNPDGSISLHARSLEFIHPVKKEKMKVFAPVPDDNLW